jgi:hypothetical protein
MTNQEAMHQFLLVMTRDPFIDSFYYRESLDPAIPTPHGQLGVRKRCAITRVNVPEFHAINNSVDRRFSEVTMEQARSSIFQRYFQANHGNLREDTLQLMEFILGQIDAIRQTNGEQPAQVEAANAR